MRLRRFIAASMFAATLALPGLAFAEEPSRTASLKASVQALEERAKAVRERADRTRSATIKKETDRIVSVVEAQRRFLMTRLQIFELVGDTPDDAAAEDIQTRCSAAERLLAIVEGWFGKK